MPELIYNVKFQIDEASLEQVSQASSRATGGATGGGQTFYEQNINNSKRYQAVIKQELNLIVNQTQARQRSANTLDQVDKKTRDFIKTLQDETAAVRAATAQTRLQENVGNDALLALARRSDGLKELLNDERLLAIAQDKAHPLYRTANQLISSGAGAAKSASIEMSKYGTQLLEIVRAGSGLVSLETALTQAVKAKTDEVRRYNAIVEVRGSLATEQEIQDYQRAVQELQELRAELLKVANAAEDIDSSQIREMNQALRGAGQAATSADRYLSGMAGQMGGVNRLGNNSTQIFLAFGDAIQDSSQFTYGFANGMRAVGNNLTFAAEQFGYAYQRAGSMDALMKEFGKTIRGPVGIIVGVNLAVTAITVFSQVVEKRLKDTREQGRETSKVFLEISDAFAEAVSAGTTDPFGLIRSQKQLDFTKRQFDSLRDPLKDYVETLNKLDKEAVSGSFLDFLMQGPSGIARGFLANFLPGVNKGLIGLQASIKGAFGDEEFRAIISQSEAYQQLSVEIEKLELKQKSYTAFLNEEGNEALKDATDLFKNNNDVLIELSLNQVHYGTAMVDTLGPIKDQIDALTSLNTLTDTQVLALSALREEYEKIASVLQEFQDADREYQSIQMRRLEVENQSINLLSQRASIQDIYNNELKLAANQRKEDEQSAEDELFRNERRIALQKALGLLTEEQAKEQGDLAKLLRDEQFKLAGEQEKFAERQAELNKMMSKADLVSSVAQSVSALSDVFGASKEIQIAMAIIDGGAAIVKTFAQLGFPAGIPAALAVAARTAQTIKQMRDTDIGDKSPIGGGSSNQSSQPKFGFQSRDVSRSPSFMPLNESVRGSSDVNVQILANRRDLYAMVQRGQQESRQIAT